MVLIIKSYQLRMGIKLLSARAWELPRFKNIIPTKKSRSWCSFPKKHNWNISHLMRSLTSAHRFTYHLNWSNSTVVWIKHRTNLLLYRRRTHLVKILFKHLSPNLSIRTTILKQNSWRTSILSAFQIVLELRMQTIQTYKQCQTSHNLTRTRRKSKMKKALWFCRHLVSLKHCQSKR